MWEKKKLSQPWITLIYFTTLHSIWSGLYHFDDFRYFHFYGEPMQVNGQQQTVGVFKCKAGVLNKIWHDTRGNANKVGDGFPPFHSC